MAVPAQPTPPAHRLVGGITDAELEHRIRLALGSHNSEWLIALEQNWPSQFLRITQQLGVEAPAAPAPPSKLADAPVAKPPPRPGGRDRRFGGRKGPARRALVAEMWEYYATEKKHGERPTYVKARAYVLEQHAKRDAFRSEAIDWLELLQEPTLGDALRQYRDHR